jgi:hypothetical protein
MEPTDQLFRSLPLSLPLPKYKSTFSNKLAKHIVDILKTSAQNTGYTRITTSEGMSGPRRHGVIVLQLGTYQLRIRRHRV